MILAWVNNIYEGVASFLVGMRMTARFMRENWGGQGGASAMTRQYPQMPAEVIGDRVRGHLFNEADICIVCHACDKVCPVDCFKMEAERTADNRIRASRFDIDLSKCIYCGLCVRACPTDSLSMTTGFEMDPTHGDLGHYLFRRNSNQLDQRLEAPDVERLTQYANKPKAEVTRDEQAWLDAHVDPLGVHLIGMFGVGYYTAEEKAKVDAEREARKKAKDAEAARIKAAAAEAAKAKANAAAPVTPAPTADHSAEPPRPHPPSTHHLPPNRPAPALATKPSDPGRSAT